LKPFGILKWYPGSIDQIVDLINDHVVQVSGSKMKRQFMKHGSCTALSKMAAASMPKLYTQSNT
jgi:hypothetical protein